jgi:hypothetical protein
MIELLFLAGQLIFSVGFVLFATRCIDKVRESRRQRERRRRWFEDGKL